MDLGANADDDSGGIDGSDVIQEGQGVEATHSEKDCTLCWACGEKDEIAALNITCKCVGRRAHAACLEVEDKQHGESLVMTLHRTLNSC